MYRTPAILGKGKAALAAKEVVATAGLEGGRRGRVGVKVRQISFPGGRPEFEYPTVPLTFGQILNSTEPVSSCLRGRTCQ